MDRQRQIDEWRRTRYKQAGLCIASGGVALWSLWRIRKGIRARQYVPKFFGQNHRVPPFDIKQDALAAVSLATTLACSTFASFVMALSLGMNVSSFREFARVMKSKLGGQAREEKLSKQPTTKEEKEFEQELTRFINKGLSTLDKEPQSKSSKE